MKQVRLALVAILIAAAGTFAVNAKSTRALKTHQFDITKPLADAKNAAFYADITSGGGYTCVGAANVCTVTFDDQNGTISLAQYLASFATPADILSDPNTVERN